MPYFRNLFLLAFATVLAGGLFFSCSQSDRGTGKPVQKEWVKELPKPTRELYASPEGTGSGTSEDSPAGLEAITQMVQPGDLVWLLEGIYTGNFILSTNGTVEGNSVNGTCLVGGKNSTANKDIELLGNYFYNCDAEIGYRRPIQATFRNNFMVDAQLIYEYFCGEGEAKHNFSKPIEVKGNEFVWTRQSSSHVRVRTSGYPGPNADRVEGEMPFRSKDVWDNNTYMPYFLGELHAAGNRIDGFITSLQAWGQHTKRAGNEFDKSSLVKENPNQPLAFVIPNDYEQGRAFVLVYGFGGASAVSVDFSKVLKKGSGYNLHRVKEAFGEPLASGSYEGGNVSVPAEGAFAVYLLTTVGAG